MVTSHHPLTDLTAELVALKRAGTGAVPRVVLFGSGLHREHDIPYTRSDVADMVRNFAAFSSGSSPPLPVIIGLDHDRAGPAVGRVTRLWEEPGGTACAEFSELPSLWAESIRRGLWFRVSAEVSRQPPHGVPGFGCCLVGATLLGRQRPQVKWTSHLTDLVRFAEAHPRPPRWTCTAVRTPTGFRTFAESDMTRPERIDALLAAHPHRNRADLEAMTDDQLAELEAATKPGGTPAPPAPKPPAPPAPPPPPQTPPAPKGEYATVEQLQQFAEQLTASMQRFEATVQARERAERDRLVTAERADCQQFAERMVREGRVPPARMDAGSADNPNWTLVDELLAHDNTRGVRTYAEADGRQVTETARDRFKRTLEALPANRFAERIPNPSAARSQSNFLDGVREETRRRYERAHATPDIPLWKRLGQSAPRHLS